MIPEAKRIWRFTPSRTDPQTLDYLSMRESLIADAVERLREGPLKGSFHHLLFIGPRGIGKSHLITLIHHKLANDPELKDRLRIAWLNEDESATNYVEWLLRIARALIQTYPSEFEESIVEQVYDDPGRGNEVLQTWLLKHLQDRCLLVIVENLDLLFDNMELEGQNRWRSFIQETRRIATLATSQQLFDAVALRTSPFFGFFEIEYLKPLDVDQATLLLRKIAETREDKELVAFLDSAEGRGRVRALHHISGGNHRIFIILAEFADREKLDELISLFDALLDDLTPYYQDRLKTLSPQQRRIVEILCGNPRPIPVKEIARKLMASPQTTANQLKQLRESGYLVSAERGRESLYELAEPLMRLALEVKEQGRAPMRILIDFLRVWYRPAQMKEWLRRLDGAHDAARTREYLRAAIRASETEDNPVMKAIEDDLAVAREQGNREEILKILEEKAATSNTVKDWDELLYASFDESLGDMIADAAMRRGELDSRNQAWLWQAGVLGNLNRYEEALASYDKAIALDPNLAIAWNNRGGVLNSLNRYEEALASYDKAILLDPKFAIAWHNRGGVLNSLKRYEEALASYDKAIALDPNFAVAWHNRGYALNEFKRYEEAVASYDKAIALNPNFGIAWHNRGNALHYLKRYDEALLSFQKSRELDPQDPDPVFGEILTLFHLGRWDEAIHSLVSAFTTHWPNEEKNYGEIPEMLDAIATKTPDPTLWPERVEKFVSIYVGNKLTSEMGDGLIRSLSMVDANRYSREFLDGWRKVWLGIPKRFPDLELAVRIFDVGMRYHMDGDRRVLLDLNSTERLIAEQALGLTT